MQVSRKRVKSKHNAKADAFATVSAVVVVVAAKDCDSRLKIFIDTKGNKQQWAQVVAFPLELDSRREICSSE